MGPIKVVVVEDEIDIRELIQQHLELEGMSVRALPTGENIFLELQAFQPDVILMDHRMPGKTGREIVKEIRARQEYAGIPIIMITGLGSEDEKLESFAMGVDDYVTKPFSIREMTARLNAVVRRASSPAKGSTDSAISFKSLTLDVSSHRTLLDGNEIQLTLTEFKILAELLRHSGRVLSRDSLRSRALNNMNVTDRTIDVHMASLRKKLGTLGDEICTIRGVGYRMAE